MSHSVFKNANGQHVDSYYAATVGDVADYPRLQDTIEAEVCIIGGGFAGISAAIELAEQGHDVVLLEGVRVGWAASGRNGGQIIGGWRDSYDEMEAKFGYDTAQTFADMSNEGKQIIYDRAEKYNINADIKKGYLLAAMCKSHVNYMHDSVAEGEKWGGAEHLSIISQQDVKSYIDSDSYIGALDNQSNGHLHPLKLAVGEAKAAAALGVRIYEHSPVLDVQGGDEPIVTTAHGRVKAKQVIMTANCYLGKAAPKLQKKIMPAGTYIIATEPLSAERVQKLIPHGQAVCDMRHILDYFRLTADNRLLFGGKTIYSGKDPKDIGKAMFKDMLKVFPQLADVKVDYAWGGHIDIAVNRMPHMGEYANNVYFVQGFSGFGVVATHIAGRVLAEKVMGNNQRYDTWNQIKHHTFPGGTLLRKPGYLLGSSFFYLRDMIDKAKG
ncbi:FAD-binding oxidoreductase [Dasania marina]|uniref:NAD(P)/FAD-dependent oxidoreductase n=1 Tax=Dasania marina TaxID=471499 RepID=UPI0030D9B964|tara:strand:- start:6 stop:1322 length:1317 start_codon:yes stop_codon:yes gene_type:complete